MQLLDASGEPAAPGRSLRVFQVEGDGGELQVVPSADDEEFSTVQAGWAWHEDFLNQALPTRVELVAAAHEAPADYQGWTLIFSYGRPGLDGAPGVGCTVSADFDGEAVSVLLPPIEDGCIVP